MPNFKAGFQLPLCREKSIALFLHNDRRTAVIEGT